MCTINETFVNIISEKLFSFYLPVILLLIIAFLSKNVFDLGLIIFHSIIEFILLFVSLKLFYSYFLGHASCYLIFYLIKLIRKKKDENNLY